MSKTTTSALLAGISSMFPELFTAHANRKVEKIQEQRVKAWNTTRSQAKEDMERKAHNDAIDAKRARKKAHKAARQAGA